MDLALKYLLPIASPALSYEHDGYLWFSEYVDDLSDPRDIGVVNGHFSAVVALHEWMLRTGDRRFEDYVRRGVRTLEAWQPMMIRDGYFGYSRDHPDFPDYGQQRAVNQARAACDLFRSKKLCKTAERYAVRHAERPPDNDSRLLLLRQSWSKKAAQ